jgi:hypothetical protein
MRCYFHLMNGNEAIIDKTGAEVSNLETAQAEALKAIREMRQEGDKMDDDDDWRDWRLDVVDPGGHVLLTIRLDTPEHSV